MKQLSLDVCGKINLSLDVTGKRDDGYHFVSMIMQTVSLKDSLCIKKREDDFFFLNIGNSSIPSGEDNIIYKAVSLYHQMTRTGLGYEITLDKKIPVEAGMAGGSADAAGVLYALNEMNHCKLSREELLKLSVRLGADVPYMLLGGTYLATGIGEHLQKLPDVSYHILVVKPNKGVSTKSVYQNLDINHLKNRPNNDKMIECIHSKKYDEIYPFMGNVLYESARKFVPEMERIIFDMESKFSCSKAMMTGSGSTVYGIFENLEDRSRSNKYFLEHYTEVYEVETTNYSISIR